MRLEGVASIQHREKNAKQDRTNYTATHRYSNNRLYTVAKVQLIQKSTKQANQIEHVHIGQKRSLTKYIQYGSGMGSSNKQAKSSLFKVL